MPAPAWDDLEAQMTKWKMSSHRLLRCQESSVKFLELHCEDILQLCPLSMFDLRDHPGCCVDSTSLCVLC